MGQYDSLRRRKDRRDSSGLSPEEERYGTISAIPRNPVMGAVSDAAGGVRSFMNKAQIPAAIPLVGGQGVGELLVGQAPEELDRWAYGDSPFVDKNVPGYSGLRGIPDIQTKRTGPLADTLFFGADAAGVGMGVRALGRAGGRKAAQSFDNAVNTGQDPSRREFIKNAGIVGAGTIAAAATPDLLKGLTRTVAKAAPNPVAAATRVASKFKVKDSAGMFDAYRKLRAARGDTAKLRTPEYNAEMARLEKIEHDLNPNAQREYDEFYGGENEPWTPDYEDYLDEQYSAATGQELTTRPSKVYSYKASQDAWKNAGKQYDSDIAAYRKENPEFADHPTREDIDEIWKDIFMEGHSGAHDAASAKKAYKNMQLDARNFEARFGKLDNPGIRKILDKGGEYIDPMTGNRAVKLQGDAWGDFEWQSPTGERAAHQHWLPEYVPERELNIMHTDGRRMPEKFWDNPELRRKFLESPAQALPF